MTASPAIEAARHFLALVWDRAPPAEPALAEALDRLASAYHATPDSPPAELDPEPPAQDWAALQAAVAERFPELGFYAVADPLAPPESPVMLADAIDDIADITRDLREVVWRAETLGTSDGEWCFRLLYFHWGRHLRELALYLHARRFD